MLRAELRIAGCGYAVRLLLVPAACVCCLYKQEEAGKIGDVAIERNAGRLMASDSTKVSGTQALALQSSLLLAAGFRHGMSLRAGGSSSAPFDSLNLGRDLGDAPEQVQDNHRRLAASLGYSCARLFELSQVHGSAVHIAHPEQSPERFRQRQGDAIVVRHHGLAAGVRVADCIALLLANPATGGAAAVHAGWRGLVSGVIAAAVAVLAGPGRGAGARVLAAVFPHIRACCFEVGQDVATELAGAAGDQRVVDRRRPRPRVSLSAVARAQLRACGLGSERIEDIDGCTRCEPERFFSYRRDGPRSGRHLAVVVGRRAGQR
ncbi:MAG: polyphenol oxidase family protein [Proteobacteria bacterium]|nr:polyphenol oxidase family protein [Pseudomonadota bacterium]